MDDTAGSAEDGGGAQERPQGDAAPEEKTTDNEWKRRAEAEKRDLDARQRRVEPQLPPASFPGLVEELSMRVLLALGVVRNPVDEEVHVDLDAARYAIDLLGVLEDKTRGNLDPGEARHLADVLYSLRLAFVQATEKGPGPEEPGPKIVV